VSDTTKVVHWLLYAGIILLVVSLPWPSVPRIVLGVCALLLLNGFERAAAKRDFWPD